MTFGAQLGRRWLRLRTAAACQYKTYDLYGEAGGPFDYPKKEAYFIPGFCDITKWRFQLNWRYDLLMAGCFLLISFCYLVSASVVYGLGLAIICWHCRKINATFQCASAPICGISDCSLICCKQLLQPPFKPMRILAKDCEKVKEAVQSLEELVLGPLKTVMDGCKYSCVRAQTQKGAELAPRMLGWIDKAFSKEDPRLVIGFEPWYFRLSAGKMKWLFRPLIRSSIRHELIHCAQEELHKLLSHRWAPDLNEKKYWRLWFRSEVPAVFGAPLSTLALVGVCAAPGLIVAEIVTTTIKIL